MKKIIFFCFFYYIIIAILVMGWLLSGTQINVMFDNKQWFWFSHLGVLTIWAIIGANNDWFRGDR